MAFEHVPMAEIADEFEEWHKAKIAVEQSERALLKLKGYSHLAPFISVRIETINAKGEAVKVGIASSRVEREDATFAHIADRLSLDFNKRARVVLEQVLAEVKADAEEKRVRFLRATMRAISGDELPAATVEECVGA